jgi:hypothetical protein
VNQIADSLPAGDASRPPLEEVLRRALRALQRD